MNIIKDENEKEYVLKCKKCGASNKPLFGSNWKKMLCRECLDKLVEERKSKVTSKYVLREEVSKEKKTRK